jgi:hypothetical protein
VRAVLLHYLNLLTLYDKIIWEQPWWDGRRDALVAQMDPCWPRLSKQEQQEALAHAERLQARRHEAIRSKRP